MVDVPVNDNIDDYKVTVFAGLTAIQVVSAILSVFAGGIEFLVFNLALGVDMTICSFIILPTVFAVVFGINFKKDGLNIIEYTKQGHWKKRKMFLGYISTETLQNYSMHAEAVSLSFEEAEKKKEQEFQALAKRLVISAVLFLAMIVFGFIFVIIIIL